VEFRIVLAEDLADPLLWELTQSLGQMGYHIHRAASGDEVLAILTKKPADLVVLDLQLPGLPWQEVLKKMKTAFPQTRVLGVFPATMDVHPTQAEWEERFRRLGGDACLFHPWTITALMDTIYRLLSEKDRQEVKDLTLELRKQWANPGDPVALLLIIEPFESLAKLLMEHFQNPTTALGIYWVEHALHPEQARRVMLALNPDIILVNATTVATTPTNLQPIWDCPNQPKAYLLYLSASEDDRKPNDRDEASIAHWPRPTQRWVGNPWEPDDLFSLAMLVRQTALEHHLVKPFKP